MKLIILTLVCGLPLSLTARETDYFAEAMAAWKGERTKEALEIISAGIQAKPKESRLWHARAQMRSLMGKRDEALADLTEAIRVDSEVAYLWQERAELRFRAGQIADSVFDFDRAVALRPAVGPYNWQRGIALWYAGRFADGRKQFESHQTVNPDDVENAVWHFLCTASELGLEEARKRLIPIKGDRRVPMKEIHALFAGAGTPEAVLQSASAGKLEAEQLRRQQFYAHLYLGLYYDVLKESDKARQHIQSAVDLPDREDYMGDVARVHARRLAGTL
jgi:lipoprotein NlpI